MPGLKKLKLVPRMLISGEVYPSWEAIYFDIPISDVSVMLVRDEKDVALRMNG